jgi:uncharacterized oligopeptide transporter (OPT) family protein
MMMALRRALIVAQHGELKYPDGTPCAEAPFNAASISIENNPALLGVGYIIGPRIASLIADECFRLRPVSVSGIVRMN